MGCEVAIFEVARSLLKRDLCFQHILMSRGGENREGEKIKGNAFI